MADVATEDDEPATKRDLRELEVRMVAGVTNAIQVEIRHALSVQREQFQSWARVFDEKYQDLPSRVSALERDVAELKARPPSPTPRTRRTAKK